MEEEEENERRRRGVSHEQNQKAPRFLNAILVGATVSDDVIMAGIDDLPICLMTGDDSTMSRLRRRILPRILRIYDWNLLDVHH